MNPSVARSFCFFACLLFILCQSSVAQDPPIQWGDIPRSDLEMKSFPADPNASALILCDYGESRFDNELDLVFKHHLRVKILTTKGYDRGTESLVLTTEDNYERIRDIEGATYTLDDNGATVTNTLDKKDIFEEKVDGKHTRYRFTLPGLKPGCIIEMRYTIITKSLFNVRDWIFQHSEPVRWSEYRLLSPRPIVYTVVTNGYEPYAVNEVKDVDMSFTGVAAGYLGGTFQHGVMARWVLQNAPALREEPFSTTMKDYANRIDIQLSRYTYSGRGTREVLRTWPSLLNELMDDREVGKRVDVTRSVRKQTEAITGSCTTPEQRMRAIYDWVARSIVWTGQERYFASQEVNDVLDTKKGNNAEITFLFLSMLQSAGINGTPVMVSTRGNGKIQDIYPIISQFNYLLSLVTIGTQTYYLDPTNPRRPFDLLPSKVLNVRGLLLQRDAESWVTLTSQKQSILTSLATIQLHEDGSLNGTFEDSYQDYAALNARSALGDKKEVDVVKDAFDTEQSGLTIDSSAIEQKDSIAVPLKLKAWVSSTSYAQNNGDFIYINPHVIHRSPTNPFINGIRKFPVDYSYGRDNKTTVVITIPDSFEVKERIGNRSLSVGSDLVSYTRLVFTDSATIRVTTRFQVNKTTIEPKYYADLRKLYTQMVSSEAEQFVLSRIRKPAPAVEAVKPEPKASRKKAKK